MKRDLDVIIVGGGPAGMSAALMFGRTMMKTVIFNEEKPRNRVTQQSHNFITRDGTHPLEFLKIAKEQLKKYDTVHYVKDVVTDVKKYAYGYQVKTRKGSEFTAQRVIFAMGYKDNLDKLDMKGVEKVYGKTVFHCPFCDGWERKNQPLAVFGHEAFLLEFVKTITNWTDDLIVFTNKKGAITDKDKTILKKNNIRLVKDKIAELMSNNGHLTGVKLANGKIIPRIGGFLFNTGKELTTEIPSKLGVAKTEFDTYKTDDNGKTNVMGIYIIEDAKTGYSGVIGAAAEGSAVAEMITREVIGDRWIT